jgi:hypothetical protein
VELVSVFLLVWVGLAFVLNLVADRVLGPDSRKPRRKLAGFLALAIGFLTAWGLYRAFDRWYLTPRYGHWFQAMDAATEECVALYAQARTARDSAAVDTMRPVAGAEAGDDWVFRCALLPVGTKP